MHLGEFVAFDNEERGAFQARMEQQKECVRPGKVLAE
jgi:hypothetical protein